MAQTWRAAPMETDLNGWSVPTWSHEVPWGTNMRMLEQLPPKFCLSCFYCRYRGNIFCESSCAPASKSRMISVSQNDSIHNPKQGRKVALSAQQQREQENGSECLRVTHQMVFNLFMGCRLHARIKHDSQQVSVRWLPVGRARLPCCWWPTEESRPRCSEQHMAGSSRRSVVWVEFLAMVLWCLIYTSCAGGKQNAQVPVITKSAGKHADAVYNVR